MPNDAKRNGGWMFLVYLLGYVLCFAAPAGGLGLLFPRYMPYLVGTALVLMFAGAGFIVSRWWDHPEMTDEIRSGIKAMVILIFVGMPVGSLAFDLLRERNWHAARSGAIGTVVIAACIYLPFFLGRAINRRRSRSAADLSEGGVES